MKTLIIEDHKSIANFIEDKMKDDITVKVTNLTDAMKFYKWGVDRIVIDIKLPDGHGLDFVRQIRENDKEVKIIIFSGDDDYYTISQCLEMNCLYVLKSDEFVLGDNSETVKELLSKKPLLTKTELKINHWLKRGKKIKEICEMFFISFNTGRKHQSNIKLKLKGGL